MLEGLEVLEGSACAEYGRRMRAQRLARSGPAGTALFDEVELPDPIPAADELLLEVAAPRSVRAVHRVDEGADLAPPRHAILAP